MGNGELWPLQNPNPLTDCQKNCHRWLHPRDNPLYQFWCKSFDGGLLGKWVKYNVKLFLRRPTYVHIYVYLFLRWTTHRSDPSTDFDAWWFKRREITQRCAFWGLQKLQVTFNPFLGPPNVDFWRKNGQKIFDWKSLTMGTPESKLPLIVIVPQKVV